MKKGEGKRASKFPPLSEWKATGGGGFIWVEDENDGGRAYKIFDYVGNGKGWVAHVIHECGSVAWGSRVRARPRDVLAELRSSKEFGDRSK